MIHIVFNEKDIEVLKKALEMDETMKGDIIQVKDDYAVGPLVDIYTTEGIAARKRWWQRVLAGGDYDGLVEKGEVDDHRVIGSLIARLNTHPDEIVWIWAAQNKHDVCGYYWLVSQVKGFQGRIYLLYLNNLPFINERGQIFYPEWLEVIPPKEFIKAKRLARPITASEFEIDPDEWTRLCAENKGVRLLEGGKKLIQEDYDFYDLELKKFVNADWQKVSKIIHQFLSKSKQTTGDAYLLWRLKGMISEGLFDVQGEVKKMRDFELKTKSGANESVTT